MMRRANAIRILLTLLLLIITVPAHAGELPAPPQQPDHGPGGRETSYEVVQTDRIGEAPTGAWIFTPDRDDATRLPVVVFLHGFSAVNPETYRAWIDH
ncbi:MAG: alpha/beta hydrolase, partial [Chloroflexota bacterium]|nr:alpha/beta hydrolase [Chloroflexota bacterium]